MVEQKRNLSAASSFKNSIRSIPGKFFGSPRSSRKSNKRISIKHDEETELGRHLNKTSYRRGASDNDVSFSPPRIKSMGKKVLNIGGMSRVKNGGYSDLDTETVITAQTQSTQNSANTFSAADFAPRSGTKTLLNIPPEPHEADAIAANALAKFEACDHYEAMKLYKSAVHLLHQEKERRDLLIAAVYIGKADVHVALYDWLPAIGLLKSALKIRLEILEQTDPRIVDVLQKLSHAMEQNDVLGRESFDSEHFEVDQYEMTNFCSDIKRELRDIDCFEAELNVETTALTGPIPLDARSLSGNSAIDRIFRDFNDQINVL